MTRLGAPNLLVLAAAMAALAWLFRPRLLRNDRWRATVTPLASIIGSGFLVLAPFLVRRFGGGAVLVMAALCALAYAVGAAIRWNIRVIGDRGTAGLPAWPRRLDGVSSWMLAFAYVVSVCYYLNLFGAFAVSQTPWADAPHARLVTSAVLALIAALGWSGGLRGLERAETLTVSLKLAVIVGLLAGLALHAWRLAGQGGLQDGVPRLGWDAVPLAFGLVITVQGFETSRYLAEGYDADTRIRTMRHAQWLASAIYLGYIGLAGLVFDARGVSLKETAVIQMMAPVASVLPLLLVMVALSAQFSAAVADTNGCGGLVQEMSRDRLPSRGAYLLLVAIALWLTWSADIYQIISYASRAFSMYYALQCGVATLLARERARPLVATAFAALAMLMLAAAWLGTPID